MENIIAAGPFLGLVNINIMLLFQIVNTLVLFAFLRWKLFGPITRMLDKRKMRIQSNIEEAEDKVKAADELRLSYENKLAKIHDEELRIFTEARHKADQRAEEIIKHAELEIEKMKAHAAIEIQRDREQALNQVRSEIVSMVMLAATKVVEQELDPVKHSALIDDVIQRVGDSKWHN